MTRFETINAIIDNHELSLSEKSLLVALWRFSDVEGYSFPSVDLLCKSASISKNTFLKVRKSLVEKRYLTFESHINKPCEYWLTIGSAKVNPCKSEGADLTTGSAKVIQFGGSKLSNEQNTKNITNNNIINNIPDDWYYNWLEDLNC